MAEVYIFETSVWKDKQIIHCVPSLEFSNCCSGGIILDLFKQYINPYPSISIVFHRQLKIIPGIILCFLIYLFFNYTVMNDTGFHINLMFWVTSPLSTKSSVRKAVRFILLYSICSLSIPNLWSMKLWVGTVSMKFDKEKILIYLSANIHALIFS